MEMPIKTVFGAVGSCPLNLKLERDRTGSSMHPEVDMSWYLMCIRNLRS